MRSRLSWPVLVSGLLFLMGMVAPVAAQPMGMPAQPTTPEGPSGVPSGLTVFVAADGGITPYVATYKGDLLFENLEGSNQITLTEGFSFQEREQRLLRLGGNVGVRFPLMDGLLLSVGLGATHLELQQKTLFGEDTVGRVPDGSSYANQHDQFRTLKPNPGFAATLGVDWEALRRSHLSMITGLKLLYVSSYGLRGASLEGEVLETNADLPGGQRQLFYSSLGTTDMVLHMLSIQPHLGVEWRAVDSYLVNTFGVFANAVVSSGKLVNEVMLQTSLTPNPDPPPAPPVLDKKEYDKTEMDLSLSPLQFMGAYYGWYLSIPHFGTIGAEIQVGGRWNAEISYQYTY